jgi:hypothetical protein
MGTIKKIVLKNIAYHDIYESEKNLWNSLYFTKSLKAVNAWMKKWLL